ncbi:MAG: carbamoyl-phosphate synthase large subunit [Anaerolineae bacterium]|nr:carbamoyl-phosphate synthase large subunit [Anaerolineae bacterium]MDW8067803.1 carbamoyl-phosphate synthase large subunit [Anaerolineae bacterium]
MPKRTDIHRILVIGSGPIVIGQACEFDYSGTQACKALRSEGYTVILVNSNPATIMTDPEFADRTYIEPLTWEVVERIIAKERPDALLPTVGGQTGLNLAVTLAEKGVLERYGVRLIGASPEAIRVAEDRELFKAAMTDIGLPTPRSATVTSLEEAWRVLEEVGLPAIIRPSFTLGGTGGGIAWTPEEFRDAVLWGLSQSPVHQVLIEESVLGWKEYELEVMRDAKDNFVVVCPIENFDPMGVHTGDSITVAPAQTLTDKEYQQMRDWARRIICRVGVETGGSNIQFAVNPRNGQMVVIEMNPRVSRSSALASKATGFPIAKIAAKLAVGYTLDEIPNDITRETMASFEPTIDYVVVKIPRWAFEKFPGVDDTLGTQMKSVGEAMAIGRTFKEALQKGLRSLESGLIGLVADERRVNPHLLRQRLITPNPDRMLYIYYALRTGMSVEEVAALTSVDPWFLQQMAEILAMEQALRATRLDTVSAEQLLEAKRMGFADAQLARFWDVSERQVRQRRLALGIRPVYKRVDTCGAEFEAYTPYLYSTYETECEADPSDRPKVIILGSGPNRIGQGIEFDYCCCHAAFALREMGIEAIMVNCNPETVSTDYDTSDRLYFEPLTLEDVLNIVETEQQRGNLLGAIVQFGGQTPLKLTLPLHRAGVRILGTPPDSIDLAEDRERFSRLLKELEIPQPEHGTALTVKEARLVAARIGYPVLVRPSYVLGGRAMAIVYDQATLERCVAEAIEIDPRSPVLIDRFLEDAFEMDVDCIADGERAVIGAIMEQIELAGIHSGDSACVIPTYMVAPEHLQTIREYTYRLAEALQVRGLMNVQMAMKDGVVYVLEVNPRASRTVPYVSKAIGVPLARLATKVIMGQRLEDLGFTGEPVPKGYFVKEVVLPFIKFREVDALLSPEMKSTGEVMGMADDFGLAFAKAQMAAGNRLPVEGTAFLSVNDNDKANLVPIARGLAELGFRLLATGGTAAYLQRHGLKVEVVNKVYEGHPHAVDYIEQGLIDLVINTPLGRGAYTDESAIRKAAVACGVAYTTTLSAASAAVQAIRSLRQHPLEVRSLQEWYRLPAPRR